MAALTLAGLVLLGLAACAGATAPTSTPAAHSVTTAGAGYIYLYGEWHGEESILAQELAAWCGHYENGLRHLFIEYGYFTAEFLNLWMQADNDDILDDVYADWAGTAAQVPAVKEFFRQIKADCPETVFHGTDVGHQFYKTGARYLEYLEQNGLEGSEKYVLAQQSVEQGQRYYGDSQNHDETYRENTMTENFIREFDALGGEGVMGIYGAAHTGLDAMAFYGEVPCMGTQLKQHYGDIVFSEDLSLGA